MYQDKERRSYDKYPQKTDSHDVRYKQQKQSDRKKEQQEKSQSEFERQRFDVARVFGAEKILEMKDSHAEEDKRSAYGVVARQNVFSEIFAVLCSSQYGYGRYIVFCGIRVDHYSFGFEFAYSSIHLSFQSGVVLEEGDRERTDACRGDGWEINHRSHQESACLDEYPRNQRIGDYLFDVYGFFSDKVFDDGSYDDCHQSEVSEVFHDVPDLPQIDIHVQKSAVDEIVGHEFSCEDGEDHPSSWTEGNEFIQNFLYA